MRKTGTTLAGKASLAPQLIVNLALTIVLAALLAIHLGYFRSHHVASINMAPTLAMDDRVAVRAYGADPGPGDVIVYRSPFSTGLLVGRLVATAGDEVAMDASGLQIDGRPAASDPHAGGDLVAIEQVGGHRYATRRAGTLTSLHFPRRIVPDGHVFVLNDNRIDERDSRIYGAIPLAAVVGVASFVYYARDESGIRWDRMTRRVS